MDIKWILCGLWLVFLSAPNLVSCDAEPKLPPPLQAGSSCLLSDSHQLLKTDDEALGRVTITFRHLEEMMRLYINLKDYKIQKYTKNENWIQAGSLSTLLTFGTTIPMRTFTSEDSNDLGSGQYAVLDYYFINLPANSAFCAKSHSEELSFDAPCSENINSYCTNNNVEKGDTTNITSLSLLMERQARQSYIKISDETDRNIMFIGQEDKEGRMFFDLRENLRMIIISYLQKLQIFKSWFGSVDGEDCDAVSQFFINHLRKQDVTLLCEDIRFDKRSRNKRSLVDLFSDTPDLLDRVKNLANHNLDSSSILANNQQKMNMAMRQQDKTLSAFMGQTLKEESNLHRMVNRMLSTSAYSQYLERRQIEKIAVVSTLSNIANRVQYLLEQQNQELTLLVNMATQKSPHCQIIDDQILCSSNSVHFSKVRDNAFEFLYLNAPHKMSTATYISCLFRQTGKCQCLDHNYTRLIIKIIILSFNSNHDIHTLTFYH